MSLLLWELFRQLFVVRQVTRATCTLLEFIAVPELVFRRATLFDANADEFVFGIDDIEGIRGQNVTAAYLTLIDVEVEKSPVRTIRQF